MKQKLYSTRGQVWLTIRITISVWVIFLTTFFLSFQARAQSDCASPHINGVGKYKGFSIRDVSSNRSDLDGWTDLQSSPELIQTDLLPPCTANHLATDPGRSRVLFTILNPVAYLFKADKFLIDFIL